MRTRREGRTDQALLLLSMCDAFSRTHQIPTFFETEANLFLLKNTRQISTIYCWAQNY